MNGIPADLDASADTLPGRLYVGYYKTNGTKTSAQARGTQDTKYASDTVLAVPTAEMRIILVKDGDSVSRCFDPGLEGFTGWQTGYATGETLVHKTPYETGETYPVYDSVVTLVIETMDTGTAYVRLMNTSNYACTMTLVLHLPDTDFRVDGQGYKEKSNEITQHFRVTIASDTTSGATGSNGGEITSTSHVPHVDTIPIQPTAGVYIRLAEDAETFFLIRVASETTAMPRDSLCITVMCFPDTGPNYSSKFVRIMHDTGYIGENDTRYGQGGSQDSVSVWALVATALVRVRKQDTIVTPVNYRKSCGAGDGDTLHLHDTVPGAMIVYTITYDNDGNRRADSITIVDYLDSNVDFYVGPWIRDDNLSQLGGDTLAPSCFLSGVDTRMAHGRWRTGIDTGIIIEFQNRTTLGWAQDTWHTNAFFDGANSDSTVDTVGALRISWPNNGAYWSLQRDQIDDLSYPNTSNVLDPLHTIDTLACSPTYGIGVNKTGEDSGDCGRIRFAVVIR